MKPDAWPEWLRLLPFPWRVISGRVQDVDTLVAVLKVSSRHHVFHYTSPEHVAGVKTFMPFLFIESALDDTVAAFCAERVLASALRSGNEVIRIPRDCLGGRFDETTNLIASTVVQFGRSRQRAARKPKATPSSSRPSQLSLDESARG